MEGDAFSEISRRVLARFHNQRRQENSYAITGNSSNNNDDSRSSSSSLFSVGFEYPRRPPDHSGFGSCGSAVLVTTFLQRHVQPIKMFQKVQESCYDSAITILEEMGDAIMPIYNFMVQHWHESCYDFAITILEKTGDALLMPIYNGFMERPRLVRRGIVFLGSIGLTTSIGLLCRYWWHRRQRQRRLGADPGDRDALNNQQQQQPLLQDFSTNTTAWKTNVVRELTVSVENGDRLRLFEATRVLVALRNGVESFILEILEPSSSSSSILPPVPPYRSRELATILEQTSHLPKLRRISIRNKTQNDDELLVDIPRESITMLLSRCQNKSLESLSLFRINTTTRGALQATSLRTSSSDITTTSPYWRTIKWRKWMIILRRTQDPASAVTMIRRCESCSSIVNHA